MTTPPPSPEQSTSLENIPVEQILVVPTLLFRELGYFQGFNAQAVSYLPTLLDPSYTSYRPRDQMEQDSSFKQLIPYCIFRCHGEIFFYTRSKGVGESRLRSKRSIGVGGHISTLDVHTKDSVYRNGMLREIEEEVQVDSAFQESMIGLLNDDLTEVGKVHLGVVHIFELEHAKVLPREESMIDSGFAQPAQLIQQREQFETWSQICLDYLVEHS
jgi:predicted NUDIX family phosphoesterase